MDQRWDDMVKHFCAVSDRLGMPIDDEIFETVIIFNILGLRTTMSCAGHVTRDNGDIRYPWIDISALDPTIEKLTKKQERLHQRAMKLQHKLRKQQQKKADTKSMRTITKKSHTAWRKYHALRHQLRKLQIPLRQKLIGYLLQFYDQRSAPFDRRLTLRVISSDTRLESQGAADFHLGEPREFQLQKLAEYREEMRAFTDFLKSIYATEMRDKSVFRENEKEGAHEA